MTGAALVVRRALWSRARELVSLSAVALRMACHATSPSVLFASAVKSPSKDLSPALSSVSLARNAVMRTCGCVSLSFSRASVASSPPRPSRVQRACIRASGFAWLRAIACNAGATDLSARTMSVRCAVSRHQPFGCARCATRSADFSASIFGCGPGLKSSWTRRQMRPWATFLSRPYCWMTLRR